MIRNLWKTMLAFIILSASTQAKAEVLCIIDKYKIENYGYSNVLISSVKLMGGGQMQSISMCGLDCSDKATDRNLSIMLTAQALNVPVQLYFSQYNNCGDVPAGTKPFGVFLWRQ